MGFIKRLFTWWNSQTLGTQMFTLARGVRVGEDAEGNRFYRTRDGKRRWVIYNGETEASRISPEWRGWLHFTSSETPAERPRERKTWEKPHEPNQTGTPDAYAPPGSLRKVAPARKKDYEAWTPE